MYIRWLSDITPDDRPLVGGKAYELSTLARLGLRVPAAFVITTRAVDLLPDGIAEIQSALDTLRTHIPAASRLVVRSSAPFEDSADFSAAGQLESIETDFESVLDAIRQCWQVLSSPALIEYFRFSGGMGKPDLAVIVQELIETDSGGVLFTVDPSGASDQMVIEAVRGSNRAITAGTVVPERLTVDRISGQVRGSADGLTPDQIHELVTIGQRLEEFYAAPQDIEWGFRDGKLYLFQTRPITTHQRESIYTTTGEGVVWVSGFFEERFPDALSPLTWSYLFPVIEQTALAEPLRYLGVRPTFPILRLYNGHVYTNMLVFQMLYKFFPPFLLPPDARRFFLDGNIRLRRQTKQPRFIRSAFSVLHTWLTEPN
jgi:rifampicin phosphotransferase